MNGLCFNQRIFISPPSGFILKDKLLIIGGSGFIGSVLAEMAINEYEVIATFHDQSPSISSCRWAKLDLPRDEANLVKLVSENNPRAVIDSIGYANVDSCEIERQAAYYLNTAVAERISQICADKSVPLIYLSTDYVFDGIKGNYTEEDAPNPINYYGATKLLGEKAVLGSTENLVIRTSSVYWNHEKCRFLNFILSGLLANEEIQLYDNIASCPTLGADLCEALLISINRKCRGIYHITGASCLTRYQFGVAVASALHLNPNLIKEIKFDPKESAMRPPKTCLSNLKASRSLGKKFATIDEGLSIVAKAILCAPKKSGT